MAEQLIHWGTERLGKRKPLSEVVSQDVWSVSWTGEDEALGQVMEYIRFAPSWANTQPWHLVVDDHQVIATADNTPKRGNVREGKPYYLLDGGIAMCHFYLAARAAGWPGMWRIPEEAERKMVRDRYAIPQDHDILGILARP
jgi:nitroreductase